MDVGRLIARIPQMSFADRRTSRENAGKWLMEGNPQQQDAAKAMISALDEFEKDERSAFVERMRGLPVAQRVMEAFRAEPPTDTDAKVIGALLDHPGGTSADLTAACGWQGQSWHLHFGMMCYRREQWLWPAEQSKTHDAKFYSGILADFDEATAGFSMKAEVQQAFRELGFRTRA